MNVSAHPPPSCPHQISALTWQKKMKYSLVQKESFIEDWQQSDQSRMAFCKEKGLVYSHFLYWIKRLEVKSEIKSSFIPFGNYTPQPTEICLPNGIIIKSTVPISFDLLSALNNV
jgi:hypothetical protein